MTFGIWLTTHQGLGAGAGWKGKRACPVTESLCPQPGPEGSSHLPVGVAWSLGPAWGYAWPSWVDYIYICSGTLGRVARCPCVP